MNLICILCINTVIFDWCNEGFNFSLVHFAHFFHQFLVINSIKLQKILKTFEATLVNDIFWFLNWLLPEWMATGRQSKNWGEHVQRLYCKDAKHEHIWMSTFLGIPRPSHRSRRLSIRCRGFRQLLSHLLALSMKNGISFKGIQTTQNQSIPKLP